MRKRVDVLTMTATPIPRTLNMSLAGIRDMSVIETPPRDRLSIQTHVVRFDQDVIQKAIGNELDRGGQVFFVHNRVESIFSIANLITRLVPNARVVVGHGQMGDDELEQVMVDFVAKKFDILVATTIIENGLDIPNANTIIVNRADRYGLAQLYQLRGRVGRSDRRAYAYLLVPPDETLSPIARKRLAAIREFSDLGSGFRIAALDLEIRGAGNLLGGEQSGHIEAVGFDMYMKLLEDTIKQLKGEDIDDERRATVNLRLDFKIEETVIGDMNQRLSVYRRMAAVRSLEELDRLLDELRDRYGAPPASILNLAEFARIRVMADAIGLESIEREGKIVMLKFRPDAKLDPVWLFNLVKTRGDLLLLPPAILKLDLAKPSDPPQRATASGPAPKSKKRPASTTTSWWTARAKAGEVTPGFSREVILAPGALDPRAADGLFERLGDVLGELSRGIQAK
jgi:transcription-repair coupling factor (superfamily II helicase)